MILNRGLGFAKKAIELFDSEYVKHKRIIRALPAIANLDRGPFKKWFEMYSLLELAMRQTESQLDSNSSSKGDELEEARAMLKKKITRMSKEVAKLEESLK